MAVRLEKSCHTKPGDSRVGFLSLSGKRVKASNSLGSVNPRRLSVRCRLYPARSDEPGKYGFLDGPGDSSIAPPYLQGKDHGQHPLHNSIIDLLNITKLAIFQLTPYSILIFPMYTGDQMSTPALNRVPFTTIACRLCTLFI